MSRHATLTALDVLRLALRKRRLLLVLPMISAALVVGAGLLADAAVLTATADIGASVTGGGFTLQNSQITAGNTVSILASGASRITGVRLAAENGVFRSGATLSVGDLQAAMGSLLFFGAPGGIASPGRTVVTPAAPASRLPAVVYNTRDDAVTAPLPSVLPDLPGTPSSLQPTQVRGAPRSQSPGAFGTARAAPAGPIELSLTATDSPVFLLSDSASITGIITASRLGVHGVGGEAVLTGTLAGRGGIATAEFADATRPIPAPSLQRYRINGCVLSAVNCAIIPQILLIPNRLAADVAVALEKPAARSPDLIVPDVGNRDF
jgi:hypothetical protein